MVNVKSHRRGKSIVREHKRGTWSGANYILKKPVQGAVAVNYHNEVLLSKSGQPMYRRKEVITKIRKRK